MDTQLARPDAEELTPYRLVFQSVQVLIPTGRYLIGRQSGCCNIILPHESVFPVHAELIAAPTSLQIRDRQSGQRIFINGAPVTAGTLQEGDVLRLGRVQCSIAVEPVSFVDVAQLRLNRAVDGPQLDEPATSDATVSSETITIADLSHDSVEIPASILEQSLFDLLDESVDDLPVVPAGHTVEATAGPRQRQTGTESARPAPLARQRLPGSDESARRKPHRRTDIDSGGSLLGALASTTAGKLALLLIFGWGSYGALHVFVDPHAEDRQTAARLQHYSEVIGDLRARQASQAEWAGFRKDVHDELPKIIEELERRASSERPATQNLLRAARDCLPRMLQPSAEPTWYEEQFHEYLADAQGDLARR